MSELEEHFERMWEPDGTDALAKVLWHEYDGVLGLLRRRIPANLQAVVSEEDLIQEVFVVAFRSFGSLNRCDHPAFRAWLYAIAKSRLIDAVRSSTAQKRDRRKEVRGHAKADAKSMANLFSVIAGGDHTPSVEVATNEAVDALASAIRCLPEEQRQAIQLNFLEGQEIKNVATQMNKSPDSVRNLIYRAKKNLRSLMKQSSLWFGS